MKKFQNHSYNGHEHGGGIDDDVDDQRSDHLCHTAFHFHAQYSSHHYDGIPWSFYRLRSEYLAVQSGLSILDEFRRCGFLSGRYAQKDTVWFIHHIIWQGLGLKTGLPPIAIKQAVHGHSFLEMSSTWFFYCKIIQLNSFSDHSNNTRIFENFHVLPPLPTSPNPKIRTT